jgi:DNA polymerase III alpha subunit
MAALFADLPEALENTVEIAQRCALRARTQRADPAAFRRGRGGGAAPQAPRG